MLAAIVSAWVVAIVVLIGAVGYWINTFNR